MNTVLDNVYKRVIDKCLITRVRQVVWIAYWITAPFDGIVIPLLVISARRCDRAYDDVNTISRGIPPNT